MLFFLVVMPLSNIDNCKKNFVQFDFMRQREDTLFMRQREDLKRLILSGFLFYQISSARLTTGKGLIPI